MIVAIGSANPVKIAAVKHAVELVHTKLGWHGDVEFVYGEVASNVSAQPRTEEETREGAVNRSRNALSKFPQADVSIGLEGGVKDLHDGMYSTVWIGVANHDGYVRLAQGACFKLPVELAQRIAAGEEMGPAMDALTGREKINHEEGMIGVVTGGAITRADEYGNLAALAYALYCHDVVGKTS